MTESPLRTVFLVARFTEEAAEARRHLSDGLPVAGHLMLLEAARHAAEDAQATLDDESAGWEAHSLADVVLGALVTPFQEHPDFQPGWMSD